MQDPENYIPQTLIAIVSSVLTWVGKFLFDRRQDRLNAVKLEKEIERDAQKSEVEMSEKLATLWRETSGVLDDKVKQMREQMDTVLTEFGQIKSENESLKRENSGLKRQIEGISKENADLKLQLDILTKRVEHTETNG